MNKITGDSLTQNLRIQTGIKRGQVVEIDIEGRTVRAHEGETIGAVLAASGIRKIRLSPHGQDPRGMYCCMGLCHDCLVTVDGQPNVRACVTPVQAGQQITLQKGLGRFDTDLPQPPSARLVHHHVPLVIIGGGPAGLSAAIAAARWGGQVLVIDENSQPGGQIYRQLPHTFQVNNPATLGLDHLEGQSLLSELAKMSDRVTIWGDAQVWSVFNSRQLAVARNDELVLLDAKAIVVATGAYERPVPVPGWTLPGVMTVGGAQVLLKSQRIRPGHRVLLAGTGPLQLVVANQMLDVGVDVVSVAESASTRDAWRYIFDLLHHPRLLMHGLGYLRRLKRHGIPLLRSHVLKAVHGNGQVERAVLSQIGSRGNAIVGNTKAFDVDTVCIGYGLIPSIWLTNMLGCKHAYNPLVGGWVPYFDNNMQTDQEGVFVAGDGAGVAGALVARRQGTIAGLFAAAYAGVIATGQAERIGLLARKQLMSLQKFRRAVDCIYQTYPAIYRNVTDDTVVCRCEGVKAGVIRRAIKKGTTDLNDVKKRTRTGMGYCQGANCMPTVAAMLSHEFRVKAEEIKMTTTRPPFRPIPMNLLMVEADS